MKTKNTTSIGCNPEVMVRVFRQGIHATVEQTVLFVVTVEAVPVKPGNPTAVKSDPQRSVVGLQHSHGDVVRQPVGGGKHSGCAIFEAKESIPVRADPQIAIPIAVDGAHLHAWDCEFQPGSRRPKQPFSTGEPYGAAGTFIGAMHAVPMRAPRCKLFHRSAHAAGDPVCGAEPDNAAAVFENMKYVTGLHAELRSKLGVWHNLCADQLCDSP